MFTLIRFFWGLYFFFILYVFVKLNYPLRMDDFSALLDTAIVFPSLFALYGFTFKKRFLEKKVWRLYFWVLLTWDFYYHFVLGSNLREVFPSLDMEFFLILLIPLYLANFLYAFIEKDSGE